MGLEEEMVTFEELPHECVECRKTFMGRGACPRCGWDEEKMKYVRKEERTEQGGATTVVYAT